MGGTSERRKSILPHGCFPHPPPSNGEQSQQTRGLVMTSIRLMVGLALAAASAGAGADPAEFDEATMYVEQNATDGDTEVVIAGTAGDDGLRLLQIKWPDREVVTTLIADRSTLGMREFHFESPEPPGEAVLAAYPEGRYVLAGVSTAGERFR